MRTFKVSWQRTITTTKKCSVLVKAKTKDEAIETIRSRQQMEKLQSSNSRVSIKDARHKACIGGIE